MADQYRTRTEGEDERPSVYVVPEQDGEKIIYKNVRKPNLPSTADIAYCEIRIAELMAELDVSKKRCFDLESQMDQYVTYEQTISQIQERNNVLADENRQMSMSLKTKIRELEQARLRILELEGKMGLLQDIECDLQKTQQILAVRDQEIKEWNERYAQLESQLTSNKILELNNLELKNQISNLQNDLDMWKERYQKSEQERKRLNDQRQETTILKKEETIIIQQQKDPQTIQKESPKFKAQFLDLQNAQQEQKLALMDKEHRIGLLQSELNKIQDSLVSKNETIAQLEQDLLQLELKDKEIERLNNLLKQAPKNVIQTVEKFIPLDSSDADIEKANLKSQLDNFSFQSEKTLIEIQQLKDKIQNQEKIISEFQRDLRQLPKLIEEIDSLQLDKQNLMRQIEETQKQLNEALNTVRNQQNKIQQLDNLQFNLKMTEQKVTQQAREILELKKKCVELEGTIFNLQKFEIKLKESDNLCQDLKRQLEELRVNNQKLQDQNIDSQIEINNLKKLESKLKGLNGTIKSLKQETEETQAESEEWRQKYNQNCGEIVKLNRQLDLSNQRQQQLNLELKNFNKEFKIPEVKVDGVPAITRIDKVVVKDNNEIQQLKNNLLTLQLQLDSIYRTKGFETQEFTRQLDTVSSLLQQKRSECELWKQKYLKSEKENTHFMNLNEKLIDLEMRYNTQKILIQSLKDRLKGSSTESEQLKSKVFQYQLQLNELDLLAKERDQQKEKANLLYLELLNLQQKLPKLIQTNNELQKQVLLGEKNAPQIQLQPTSQEKLKSRIAELESQIDETKDDQITALQNRLNIVDKELSKQLELNQQYVKEIQNIDRKKQDAVSELQQLQTKDLDSQQVRTSYFQKLKEADTLRMDVDKTEYKMQNMLHEFDRLKENEQDLKNQIERQKQINQNQQLQLNKLLQHLNSLENKLSNQRHIIDMYPELEDTIAQQREEIQNLQQQFEEVKGEKDSLMAEIQQMELQFLELQPLHQQCDQLKEISEQRQNEINLWQQRYAELESKRAHEGEEWRVKFDNLSLQLKNQGQMELDLKQLNEDLQQLLNDNKKYQEQNSELSKLNMKQKNEMDNKDIEIKRYQTMEREYKKLCDLYQNEIAQSQDLSEKLKVLQNQYDELRRDQERLENKLAMLSSEVERLQVMVKNKNQQIESQQGVLHQQQQQIDQIQPIQQENKRLMDELNKGYRINDDLKQQIINLSKQLDDRKTQIANDEQYIQQLQETIEKLNQNIRSKEDEMSETRGFIRQQEGKLKDLQKDEQQWNDQQEEMSKINQQMNYLTEVLESKLEENENLLKQNTQLQSQLLDNQKLDFDLLEQTLQARDKELDEWRKRFAKMSGDFEKLYAGKLEQDNKLASFDLEIERWKRKANSNQGEIQLLRGIIDQLNVEIERLNKNCIDLLKENDEWRLKYGTLQEQIPQLVQVHPNPDTQVYQVTPGNSFRMPPSDSQGEIRRSVRRSLTINNRQ